MTTTTQTKHSPADQAEQKFMELLRDFHNAMLVSHGADELHARPMAIAEVSSDGSLWFLTGSDSKKALEVSREASSMAVMQSSAKYLSVTGHAEIVHDRDHVRRLWKDAYKVYFKDKDDPSIVLIRFTPRAAEYWDNSGFEGWKFALRYAKAYVGGGDLPQQQENDVKSHAKVAL
jgi:general stress protein 26